jgi:predicted benzoate:H+ symporter BenE
MTGVYIESLNQVIDLHESRVFFGLYSRVPLALWLILAGLVVLGMVSLGYQAGLSATRRSLAMPIFALAFAGVLYLIVDLDRGYEGFLQISQQAMIDLEHSMEESGR